MANKLASLQSALNHSRGVPAPAPPEAPPAAARPAAPTPGRQANRKGKVNLAAWLDPGFKASLRLVQARRPGSIQELMEEAFNDLFAKYDVPQVTARD